MFPQDNNHQEIFSVSQCDLVGHIAVEFKPQLKFEPPINLIYKRGAKGWHHAIKYPVYRTHFNSPFGGRMALIA